MQDHVEKHRTSCEVVPTAMRKGLWLSAQNGENEVRAVLSITVATSLMYSMHSNRTFLLLLQVLLIGAELEDAQVYFTYFSFIWAIRAECFETLAYIRTLQ